MNAVHGTARLSEDRRVLTITTPAKRGAKIVENRQTYLVEDARPDPRVCSPAFKLTKGHIHTAAEDMSATALEAGAKEEFVPSDHGEVWFVSVNEWGAQCSCPHATFRTNGGYCKHILACRAVQLLPKDHHGSHQETPQEVRQPDPEGFEGTER